MSAAVPTQSSVLIPHSFAFNGVVRFTKVGTTYLLTTLVIGFAALNTGNNALYIGFTFLLGSLMLSGLASKGGLKHLEVEISGVDEAWAGQPAHGRLRIHNRSKIWNVRDIVIVSDELAQPVLIPLLMRKSESFFDVEFLFQRRGRVELKKLDFYTRYPFGFFLKKRRLRVSSEVIVFPRLLDERVSRERFRLVSGEQVPAGRAGAGTEVHSFREYVRGDSLRHVHWKKSASLGRWIMKQTELEAARAVHVVVDPYKPRGVEDDVFEEMISEATTLVWDAVRRGLDVLLSMPRVTLRASEAQSAEPLFRALALIEPSHEQVEQMVDRNSAVFSLAAGRSPSAEERDHGQQQTA
ncbi:MAG TPA: DUF58 domain-containing protein, partial [Thermoanaerobaculia bacterium]|nr:DUF58 domain-containing protein [Thermoanaerobaculia bacterium]